MTRNRLIDFLVGKGVDDRGRTLIQIIEQADDWLESTHDFIQWLFPLVEKSGASPTAPLIDVNLVSLFQFNTAAQNNMLLALDRMLSFYGLQRKDKIINKGENWYLRNENWFVSPTHNNLRITRMLKSMSILGLDDYAQGFLETLLQLSSEPECGFGGDAMGYWKSAVLEKWNPKSRAIIPTEVEYSVASREQIQASIQSLLKMARRFSELEGVDHNETFRWNQARFQIARVAFKSGVIGKTDYGEEHERFVGHLAEIGGDTISHVDLH